MKTISFVIPVYNSRETLAAVVERILGAMGALSPACLPEIVLVDDGSRDGVWEVCQRLHAAYPFVRAFRMARNFGQASALMAGLNQAAGDFVVCLDDDLQTPPEEFPKLYHTLLSGGFDVVYGYYPQKKHSAFRNFGTALNEAMENFILGKPKNLHTSSYFIARRYVVDVVRQYDKPFPYLPGLFLQVTGSVCSIPIHHEARTAGRSGYSLGKLVGLWLNGFTNFSIKPLRAASLLGGVIAVSAFLLTVALVIQKAMLREQIQMGWTSTIILILFIGGVQLLCAGMLGEYIGRIYLSVNKTPQYVLREEQDEPPAPAGRAALSDTRKAEA